MMRVLVTGSRHWDRYDLIEACLDEVARDRGVITIVHGGARGADRLAGLWARRYGHRVEVHPADWDRWGRSAGFRRNQEMVATNPDLVIAFRAPGTSRGTDHCIQAAQRAGLPVKVVTP